ncbi:MAG: AMP-binding protein [Caldilineaceae bacterium]
MALQHLLAESARRQPAAVAVSEPGQGAITYQALAELSDCLRDRLSQLGVQRGDRVGIYLHKSIDAIAALFGILKTGAAYVPVDPNAPPARNAYILHNCSVKVAIVEACFTDGLRTEMERLGPLPPLFCLAGTGGGQALQEALTQQPATTAVIPTVDSARAIWLISSIHPVLPANQRGADYSLRRAGFC